MGMASEIGRKVITHGLAVGDGFLRHFSTSAFGLGIDKELLPAESAGQAAECRQSGVAITHVPNKPRIPAGWRSKRHRRTPGGTGEVRRENAVSHQKFVLDCVRSRCTCSTLRKPAIVCMTQLYTELDGEDGSRPWPDLAHDELCSTMALLERHSRGMNQIGKHRSRYGILYGIAAYGSGALFLSYFKAVAASRRWKCSHTGHCGPSSCWPPVGDGALAGTVAGTRQPQTAAYAPLATLLIAANWLLFIYAVTSGHVLEASLGYFINPLVSVLLGVVFLRERLRTRRRRHRPGPHRRLVLARWWAECLGLPWPWP